MKSALYRGVVLHHRLRPKVHRLRYRLYWLLLDLDELPALHRSLRLFSFNRPNLLGFHERDHLDGSDTSLRTQIAAALAGANIPYDGGPIRVLCMPRALGSVFNPISVWFCHRKDESLAAMLYEVNNTFGERHSYLIPVAPDASGPIHQHCDKAFHVSPFMRMAMEYDFRVAPPGDTVSVIVGGSDAGGKLIETSFTGGRQPLDDRGLAGVVLRHGFLAWMVLLAIHWEALKLWLKGMRLQPKPAAPAHPITFVQPHES